MGQGQPRLSEDGRFYWDGQAWRPMPAGAPSTISRLPGGIILAGAALIAISTFLPWLSATAPFVGTITRSLMDNGSDGPILAVLAGLVLLIGLAMSVKGPLRIGSIFALLLLILASVTVVVDYTDLQGRVTNITNTSNLIIASVGAGPYVAGFGIVIAGVGSAMALFKRGPVAAAHGSVLLQAASEATGPHVIIDTNRPSFAEPPTEVGSKLGVHSSDGAWYWNGERWLPNS